MSATITTTRKRLVRPVTVLGAVAAALAIWVVAVPLAGVDLRVRSGDGVQQVGALSVLAAGLVAGLLGWALLAALERLTRRPRAIWVSVAAVVLVVSLAGPLGGVTTAAKLVLACLHVTVAAVLIGGLAPTAGSGSGGR